MCRSSPLLYFRKVIPMSKMPYYVRFKGASGKWHTAYIDYYSTGVIFEYPDGSYRISANYLTEEGELDFKKLRSERFHTYPIIGGLMLGEEMDTKLDF